MFLQNIDATVITTALPSMAASLGVPPMSLNLVITTYLLSLAVFLPMSAWLTDRYGAKRMFCVAIVLFSLASALCGMSTSVTALVVCRVFQGLGAAMMVPVGRLILLRSVPPSQMIAAMVWYTVPPMIGRLVGPMVGGAIVSVTSWHWIFFVNVPLGAVALLLTLLLVEDTRIEVPSPRFDFVGFVLMAVGLAAMLGTLDAVGKGPGPAHMPVVAATIGAAALCLYALRSLNQSNPVIDLRILKLRTFRTNVLGAAPLRLAQSAVPFLLPLMLQLGFGVSPLISGVLTAASGVGALCTRALMYWAIRRFGFRRLLLGANALTGLWYISYALFSPVTSHVVMYCTLLVGGLLSSMCMVSLNTLGFADVPRERLSHATALLSMAQQLTAGVGVVLGASSLRFFQWLRHGEGQQLLSQDFAASFVVVGLAALLSLAFFVQLKPNDGHQWR
jgi:EmrB/QacA subfamily drug resistance transporter